MATLHGTIEATPPRPLGEASGQWVGVVANAGSGQGKGKRSVAGLAARLDRLGVGCRVAWTLAERAAIVREAADDPDCRCLVAAGGDGTVSSLLNERPAVPIAVLPAGTENLFARQFRFGREPGRLARRIASGRAARLDLGLAGGRRFGLMVGVGFDADVVTRHHRARLNAIGLARPTTRSAYVEPVLRSTFTYNFPSLTVQVDGPEASETIIGTTAFVFNLPRYALGLPFAPAARGDDGWLDLVVFRHPGAIRALHYLWLVLRGKHLRRADVLHRRVQTVTISCGPAAVAPIQLDGDPGGTVGEGLTLDVLPGEVEVIVP